MNDVAWKQINEEKENLQPTPPVGERVVWYPRGDRSRPVPADVMVIEEAGRLRLELHLINQFKKEQAGVYHVSHRTHEKPNNPTTVNCGSWDYVRGKIPKEDYRIHQEKIELREKHLQQAQDQAQLASATFQTKLAEKKAEAKKRLPEILPADQF